MKKTTDKLAVLLDGSRWSSIAVSLLSILLSLICASVILLILGKNPLVAFQSFLQGAGFWPKESYGGGNGILSDLFTFLNLLAPMILAALSFMYSQRSFKMAFLPVRNRSRNWTILRK